MDGDSFRPARAANRLTASVAPEALASPILILGAQRSGTTWLAKIIDSHPDVLYRHEPDETLPSPSPLDADRLPGLLARWTADRGVRAVGIKPFFPKTWQSEWAPGLRRLLSSLIKAADRLPEPLRRLGQLSIPDLASRPAPRIAIKSIRWAQDAAVLACAMPSSRTVLILRHPCGQVASVMRGNRQRRFDLRTEGTDMPFDEASAIRFAAGHGVHEDNFHNLPDAAKYAWAWRAFNEPAYQALAPQPNVQVILYEALCARPEPLTRRIFAFAGLGWNPQTSMFLERSTTHQGKAGYYAVFRDAAAAAEKWRTTLPQADQHAIQAVVAASPLARFWPDLMTRG